MPQPLQAQAWAALGKLSLVDEPLCRATVPLMVSQLSSSTLPAVRNNILLVLSDMCMQYTLLVDPHLGKLAASMNDSHPLVRKQTLALMASLLQREFVKWRGPLFVQCAPLRSGPRRCCPSPPAALGPVPGQVWQAVSVGKAPSTPENPILSGVVHGQLSGHCSGVVCQTLAVVGHARGV